MTRGERELRAMDYRCPVCLAQPHFSCRQSWANSIKIRYLRHPHDARIRLVKKEEK